jgi:hypothetical protein
MIVAVVGGYYALFKAPIFTGIAVELTPPVVEVRQPSWPAKRITSGKARAPCEIAPQADLSVIAVSKTSATPGRGASTIGKDDG